MINVGFCLPFMATRADYSDINNIDYYFGYSLNHTSYSLAIFIIHKIKILLIICLHDIILSSSRKFLTKQIRMCDFFLNKIKIKKGIVILTMYSV